MNWHFWTEEIRAKDNKKIMENPTQWGRSTRSNSSSLEIKQKEVEIETSSTKTNKDEHETDEEEESIVSSKNEDGSDNESLKTSVNILRDTIDKLTATLASVDTKFKLQENRVSFLENKCEIFIEQNNKLVERINVLENASKIQNIKIDGLKERNGEDVTEVVLKMAEAMGSTCRDSDIANAYRMGKKQDKQTCQRTIMIKFKTKEARHEFYNQRFNLKNKKDWSRVWLNNDVSDPTRRWREAMRAITILCRDNQTDCKLRSESITIKDHKFWINELERIPSPYSLEDAKIRTYNGELYFQSEYAWPSTMAPARVTVDKHTYFTAEHAWNGVKAKSNNDLAAADLIKKTQCPY